MDLSWRMGVEIELLAPPGQSRQDLAEAIAYVCGGAVRRYFHPQVEPSHVPGTPVFENLTLGFEVLDAQGQWLARCVDDLTLQEDLEKTHPPQPGWYRIVSDDTRLLQLLMCQADATASLNDVLNPIAQLFGTQVETAPGGMRRVADSTGKPIAIAAPLPGERERPCELITAPIEANHLEHLDSLLAIARALEFTIPLEGATHLHFDATRLCSAPAFTNLVHLFYTYDAILQHLFHTNPNCRRLGHWPETLLQLVQAPDFATLSWADAQSRSAALPLTKYCNFNLKNLVHSMPDKFTFEVRILPVWLDAEPIIAAAAIIEALLNRAIAPEPVPYHPPLDANAAQIALFLEQFGSSDLA